MLHQQNHIRQVSLHRVQSDFFASFLQISPLWTTILGTLGISGGLNENNAKKRGIVRVCWTVSWVENHFVSSHLHGLQHCREVMSCVNHLLMSAEFWLDSCWGSQLGSGRQSGIHPGWNWTVEAQCESAKVRKISKYKKWEQTVKNSMD